MERLSSRPYHSPRREEAARETRRLVLEAARQQFVKHGYSGTSLADIAAAAGVSVATVKLLAGSKAQLLVTAIRALMRRDEPTIPHVEQRWWRQMLADPDPEALLRQFASIATEGLQRQADLFDVVYQAAASEPELAELEREGSLGRWQDVRQVARALADLGALRPGLTPDAAADTIWAVAAPQLYRLLITRRGWSAEQWQGWLADMLIRSLLVPGA